MATIEFEVFRMNEEPPSSERLDVNVWGTAGRPDQPFYIGNGVNFNASSNYWLEIRYSVRDIPIFYSRNILSSPVSTNTDQLKSRMEDFLKDQVQVMGFGDMYPDTSLLLKRDKHTYDGPDDEPLEGVTYTLTITLDTGSVFGWSGPMERMVKFIFYLEPEQADQFLRSFVDDIERANRGKHPNPADLPMGFSNWPLVHELNRRAYDKVSTSYSARYFENPHLAEAFNLWMEDLPKGGQILDAGCGHGIPVIEQLIKGGFQVTGCDLSSVMLEQARNKFPTVTFWECAINELEAEARFDGVCSFSSMLYMDPIDFYHSVYRLHQALKPGGLLFLFGYDPHPSSRSGLYHVDLKHWMWGGNRGIEETVQALEEHGYFKVLKTANVITEEERQEYIDRWCARKKKEHEERVKNLSPGDPIPVLDLSTPPANLAYPYVVVAQKQ
jgi:SAM-dependent methyltransferase